MAIIENTNPSGTGDLEDLLLLLSKSYPNEINSANYFDDSKHLKFIKVDKYIFDAALINDAEDNNLIEVKTSEKDEGTVRLQIPGYELLNEINLRKEQERSSNLLTRISFGLLIFSLILVVVSLPIMLTAYNSLSGVQIIIVFIAQIVLLYLIVRMARNVFKADMISSKPN